ncbi:MAG: adenosylcobinamide-phosphate synthase CbiB [Ramlibacter sp.]
MPRGRESHLHERLVIAWSALLSPAALALLLAFALDWAWGEPPVRWHPVVWMGGYLGWAGRRIAPRHAVAGRETWTFLAGALAWSVGATSIALIAWGVETALQQLPVVVATVLLGVLFKPLFAWRMLRDEVLDVEAALGSSLEAGRLQLGRLVSRDVARLGESDVREAAIESLAENFCDSVVAPVFWFVLAGLPGAALYRFANTADAMWGYRGMRQGADWTWAGKWAARADDVLSWIPARIAALLLIIAARGLPLAQLRRDAVRTLSPNSGWPMAAMALALQIRLGKAGVYALNAGAPAPDRVHTARAVSLNNCALAVLLAIAYLTLVVMGRPW